QRVIIAGGGNIGLYVAQAIEFRQPNVRVKVIERDHDRAVSIAEQLNRTVVLNGDTLSEELLREAGAGQADAILALTNDEQANILSCVLARQIGCPTSMCLYNSRGYAKVIRSLGIDAHVNPRSTTVSRVLQHVRRGRIKAVHSIQNGAAEVIEGVALATSAIVGRPLRSIDLPESVRIGAILRDDTYIMPKGETVIEAGDRIVVFALADHVRTIENFFRVNVEFID
ncbi:MAG: Trk system potassium transporter TrkA, partial [Pseudomonadota bacterium]